MMQLSRELAIFIAPNINSYKRYASLSWAPVNVVWAATTGRRRIPHGSCATRPRRPLSSEGRHGFDG